MRRLLCVALFLAVAGCSSSRLTLVAPQDLPPDLYGRPIQGATPRTARVVIYMVEGNRLAAVARVGRSSLSPQQLAMRELLTGPTRDEIAKGLTTHIPESVHLLNVSIDRKVASVDLSRDFELAAERTAFLLRIAQVVWTLTELDTVDAVRFSVDGQPVSVLDQDARTVNEPVARGRYSQFAPSSSGAVVSEVPLAGGS